MKVTLICALVVLALVLYVGEGGKQFVGLNRAIN